METIITKVLDQSLSVGIMLVVFWYQRQDRKELMAVIEKASESRNELKAFLVEKIAEGKAGVAENRSILQQILDRMNNAKN